MNDSSKKKSISFFKTWTGWVSLSWAEIENDGCINLQMFALQAVSARDNIVVVENWRAVILENNCEAIF
jgi:hypothetical protein